MYSPKFDDIYTSLTIFTFNNHKLLAKYLCLFLKIVFNLVVLFI